MLFREQKKDMIIPFGRYEKYPIKDCALLMTAADNFFWTFEQAVSYYKFALVNYIGFHDKGMVLAGGCGDNNGKAQIEKTEYNCSCCKKTWPSLSWIRNS